MLLGLLFGLMLGRLFGPGSLPEAVPQLLAVEQSDEGLLLRFDRQAAITAARVEGALTLRIAARGVTQQGDGRWQGQPLRWRIREEGKMLLLSLVSTRPLEGRWQWSESGGAGAWPSNCRGSTAGNKRGNSQPACTEVPKREGGARIAVPPG